MRDKTIIDVLLGIGLFIATSGATAWLLAPQQKLSNENAVMIEVAIAVLLSVAFFVIQNRNIERRKQFWLDISYIQLGHIIDSHRLALSLGEKILRTQSVTDERASLAIEIVNVETGFVPQLDRAISQVADLISEPSLFDQITRNKYAQFMTLLNSLRSELDDYNKTQTNVRSVKERIDVFQKYREKIREEMPNKKV